MWQFFTAFLGSGAGGIILRLGNGLFEEWKAGREQERKLEEMKVMASIKQDEAAWEAFKASQAAAVIPSNVHPITADILTLFRPFITLILVAVATFVWFYAVEPQKADMTNQVAFAAFNAVGWWFGDRAALRLRK